MKQNSLRGALVFSVLLMQFGLHAQTEPQPVKHVHNHNLQYKSVVGPDGYVRCHTMEMDSIRRANDPSLPTLAQEEAALQQHILQYKAQQASSNAKKIQYTIPVIFHIFTDGSGAENVSATQIQAQLDQLNIDYGNMAGSPYAQAADSEIDFCLAAVDEGGAPLAEAGINRITSYGQGPFSSGDFDGGMKQATQWDPTKYFNIWVADLSGGLLGYAQFPDNSGLAGMPGSGGAANTDGVVILYSTVGSVASPFSGGAPYNLGRTLTHEAGHWLGLRHIWGDSNCGDDFCADTPESQTSNYNCVTQTTCDGQQDMVENYMDYTNDACMNTFTADQNTRMQTVMGVSPRRMEFVTSTVCNSATDPDDVGVTAIGAPTGTICGSSFIPEVTVTNFGTNSVTSFTLTYDIDGSGPQIYNWTGTLTSGQSTVITLGSMTTSAGPHTFNAATSLPNGNADTNAANDAGSSGFTLDPTGSVITLFIDTDCYGEETVWELFDDQSTLIGTGGNNNVTTPVTTTQGTSSGDPGAYPNETTITEEWCLADGCYDLIVWDAYGDGLNGSSVAGCNTDGDFHVEDGLGTVLASMQTANGAFGFSETVNFCVAPPCTPTSGSESVTACDTYTWSANSTTYTSSGAYTATLTNAEGCDSTATLNLTINNSTSSSETVTACDTYTWAANSTTYTSSGTYTATFTNAAGCDSITTLNLTVNNSTAGSETVVACVNYTWSANSTTYTTSGTYTATLTNAAGCDSTATLNLTITTFAAGTDVITACDAHTWIDGTTYTSSNNTATHTIVGGSVNGCDSVVTLNLTINYSSSGSESATACESYTWSANGITYTTSGTYTAALMNAAGCDSTATLNLTINDLPTVTLDPLGSYCDDATDFSLSGGSPAGGTYSGTGVTGGVFSPVTAGVGVHTITYSYTDGNGCTNSESADIEVKDCSSIEELSGALTISPNPTSGSLYITAEKVTISQVRIYDGAGRLVFVADNKSETIVVDMVEYARGVYTVEVNAGNQVLHSRVVKE